MDENKAFVQILALAIDDHDFRLAAAVALDDIGFDLVEIEDVDRLEDRLRAFTVDEQILVKADEVRTTGRPRFGPFVTWTTE